MKQQLRFLALVATAALALASATASAAHAVEFHSEAETTTITAQNVSGSNTVFDWAGTQISCKSASFSGSQTGKTASQITVTPTYSNCTALGISIGIKTNGCDYVFHANGEVDVGGGTGCSPGITVEFAGCKIVTPAQTGLSSVSYTNEGSGSGRTVKVTPGPVKGITYTSSGFCPKTGTYSDGEYTTGTATTKGSSGGKQVGIWVE